MMESHRSSSLFDDIFKLQNTAPDADVDPEDQDDGIKASLVDRVDPVDAGGTSLLRKRSAIIPEDPKYQGKKTSRKDLYGEDVEDDTIRTESSPDEDSESAESGDMDDFDEEEQKVDREGHTGESTDDNISYDDEDAEDEVVDDSEPVQIQQPAAVSVLPPSSEADDREKGKALMYQLGVWDDLIKSRIVLQKMVTACNRLPLPDTWARFAQHEAFTQEAKNVHSSVRKLLSALLELQSQLASGTDKKAKSVDSDEEITSSSEDEQSDGEDEAKKIGGKKTKTDDVDDEEKEGEEEDENEEEDSSVMEDDAQEREEMDLDTTKVNKPARGRQRHRLNVEELEETLAERHRDFQAYRNDTLSKWDEKTRLAHGKIKAKNFAAFEMSVLKQIEQILVNRERLVKRLHQQRASYRILGQLSDEKEDSMEHDQEIDDDDDDVEVKLQSRVKQEVPSQQEIIDDNDFYHLCLRDLIELKQNEETDPVTSNKQWLEIQRLRNKQKRKVDTKASKGRKVRYNVKEKLKNYMTPYDKSQWSEEQKDDLFKALFGGRSQQQETAEPVEPPTINIGL